MSPEKIVLAIFDFDGTLTEGHLWKGIAKYNQFKKRSRARLFWYVITHLPYWLAAKIKIYPDDLNRAKWGRDLAMMFKDYRPEDVLAACDWIALNYFTPLMRPDMLRIIEEHKKNGHRLLILSGMFNSVLEAVAHKLGVDYVVGTPLEIKDGRLSGKIVPPLCFGENKANYLLGYVQKKALDIDFGASFAYADSIYDNPVFRLVGHPVAVYPDTDLLKQARKMGWPVIQAPNR
jgi:HAD superfamily hydrolase (TIGR01490 family)